jgi:uncharacterized damage-inducible protein DinB
MKFFLSQYASIESSRKVVFDFCKSFKSGDYIKPITFNGKSIAQLHVHVANTYLSWLVIAAQRKEVERFRDEDYTNVEAMEKLYQHVNTIVYEYVTIMDNQRGKSLTYQNTERTIHTTSTELFTHVITHEFHHKGQMMMLARSPGYVPPDSDAIRFYSSHQPRGGVVEVE